MSSIFGDTDDIAFGGVASLPAGNFEKKSNFFEKKPPVRREPQSPVPKSVAPRTASLPNKKHEAFEPTHLDTNISALSRLIASMKPTFLPTGGEETLRIVPLSATSLRDGAFLIRAQETTLFFGSGFSSETVNGIVYPTFPDMRIVASEKDRLAAWILTDDTIEVALIAQILPTLDFVPVYASRGLISKIRTALTGNPILEKCRFFELFTGETSERKIGDIEVATLQVGGSSFLSFRFGDTTVYDARKEVTASLPKTPRTHDIIGLTDSDGEFTLTLSAQEGIRIFSGEIISLRPKKIEKHTLKFTFDTFYVDKQSIGVVAGYTLKDRKELGENGVLTFVLEEDRVKRAIIAHIYIDSRGFVHSHEMMSVHKEVLKGIRSTYEKSVLDNPRIERAELVQTMRRELTKYCYLLTGRTPVVLPIILER